MSTTVSNVSSTYSATSTVTVKQNDKETTVTTQSTQADAGHSHTEPAPAPAAAPTTASSQDALANYGQAQVNQQTAASTDKPAAAPASADAGQTPAAAPKEVPKVATSSKDWEEVSLHLAAKADKTSFKDTDIKSHIDHHLDDGKTLNAIGQDQRFTEEERKFATEKGAGQDKYSTVMNDMNRYWNFYGKDGQADAAKTTDFAKQFEMYDGQAGISDADRAKADQIAKEQGIELRELGASGHAHPPAPPTTQPGEVLVEDVLKTYRNIDKFNAGNVKQTDITKLVDGNQKMVDLLAKATDLGYKEMNPTFKSGVEDLDKKAKKNISTGNFLNANYNTLAASDDNFSSLSVGDIKAPNTDNNEIMTPREVRNQGFDNTGRMLGQIGQMLDGMFQQPPVQQPPVNRPPVGRPPALDTSGPGRRGRGYAFGLQGQGRLNQDVQQGNVFRGRLSQPQQPPVQQPPVQQAPAADQNIARNNPVQPNSGGGFFSSLMNIFQSFFQMFKFFG